MSKESPETNVDITVERLKMKYLQRKKVCAGHEAFWLNGRQYQGEQRMVKVIPCNTKELSAYNRALQELFQAVNNPPNRFDSDCSQVDSDDENSTSCPLLETEIHYTETDVTLPSSLAGSSGSCETEPTVGLAREKEVRAERPGNGASQRSSPVLCPSAMGQVNREMLHIYRQLQTEHLRQQKWAGQLQDRENKLLQQEVPLRVCTHTQLKCSMCGPDTHSCKFHQSRVKEARQLQDQLKERTRENKRLMASFNSIKEHNDTMKKQLNDLSEQNKHLENQFRKVQARLENLQGTSCWVQCPGGRPAGFSAQGDVLLGSVPRGTSCWFQCPRGRPAGFSVQGDVLLGSVPRGTSCWFQCPGGRPAGFSAQGDVLLGSVSRVSVMSKCCVSCPPADVVAQVLDSLHSDLVCVDVRGLFLRHGGMSVLLALLRCGKVGLQTSIDILLQLSGESRYQHEFLSACSTEDFFRMAALLVKKPRLELPLLEKLSIILQKLSKIRKNRRLFELCSLHLLLQEMHRSTDPTHTFLLINLSSILLNLNTHTL
uniref:Coiled-coil domain-containing protein 138 n=1 Tax=Esox lucius TaxID=8010 RepID=A0A3P8XVU0_ESOLU